MIATLKLVERQIAMSDIKNRLEEIIPQKGRFTTSEGVAFGPCLLISRECGSGSRQLAQEAGEQLGWNVFDSKIVDEIAKVARVHERLVESVDERVHSYWEQTWREMLLDELPDSKYLKHLRQVVLALANHGNVVMVGRGAQYFLPPQCALRVRLVAPLELRVQRIAADKKVSAEQARAIVDQTDQERSRFVRKTFGKETTSALNHDLIVNTGEFPLTHATQLVLAALHEKLGVQPGARPLRDNIVAAHPVHPRPSA